MWLRRLSTSGADRVGVRLSPIGTFNSIGYAAETLGRFGLAYLHVVEDPGHFDWADLKRRFRGPYMANGGYDRGRAEAVLAEGRADVVSFATPYIANPDLAERLRRGAPLARPDRSTFYGGDHRGYTDYPSLHQAA
jgi:N-ethylmaleimide reductase